MTTSPDPNPVTAPARSRAGRPQSNSYTDLMKPGESLGDQTDATERRKIKNRLAQRAYRRNMRDRTKEVELLKSQIKELQQSTTHKTGITPDSPDYRVLLHHDPAATSYSRASTSPGAFDTPSLAGPMNEWDWNSYLDNKWAANTTTATSEHEIALGGALAGLDWTTDLDHTLGSSGRFDSEATKPDSASGSASTPASTCASGGAVVVSPSASLVPISPAITVFTASSPGAGSSGMQWHHLSPAESVAPSSAAESFHSPGMSVDDSDGMGYLPPSSPPLSSKTRAIFSGRSSNTRSSSISRTTSDEVPRRTHAVTVACADPILQAGESCMCTHRDLGLQMLPGASEPLIHLAIARGKIDTLRLLLQDCHISVNVRDKVGYTPLQRAVISGRTDMVALLIKHGADPT